MKLKKLLMIAGVTLSGTTISGVLNPANALTFNFSPTQGMSQSAIDGFTQAGNIWSSLFTDNVTVNININFTDLGSSTLGGASSRNQTFNYSQVYTALNHDKISTDDISAVGSLSTSSTFNRLINHTSNNSNSANTYSNSSSKVSINTANAKALGLIGNNTLADANISFNNTGVTWDFDQNNGISSGAYDFVSTAVHEIGHVLGFDSGVDYLDYYAGLYADSNSILNVSTLDLFRYSTVSKNLGAIDFTTDKRTKYLSLDGGATAIAAFATGETYGDGDQASHWQAEQGLGIMDPYGSPGTVEQILENDLRALDVIGWNRVAVSYSSATAVPEPSNIFGTLIFAAFGVKMAIKRKRNLHKSIQKLNKESQINP